MGKMTMIRRQSRETRDGPFMLYEFKALRLLISVHHVLPANLRCGRKF
jgi:hypothetical protein